jgi:hypothetical protein
MQGAQKLRSEAHSQVRRNDEVEAQSRSERDRWTFYETILFDGLVKSPEARHCEEHSDEAIS